MIYQWIPGYILYILYIYTIIYIPSFCTNPHCSGSGGYPFGLANEWSLP